MIPARFEYERPASLATALQLMRENDGETALLSGGHSLVPLLKLRMATPERIVDLGGIDGLDGIDESADGLVIGALATHSSIAAHPIILARYPMLAEAAGGIGDAQVRDWGTIGGSCAHAHPASDWPAVLVATRAELVCTSLDGERVVPARDFFLGIFTTAIEPTEVLTAVRRFPSSAPRSGGNYRKLVRPSGDFAVVGVATGVELGDDGAIVEVGIGLTGAADVAFAATDAEEMLAGEVPSDGLVERAAQAAAAQTEPIEDANGGEAYKRAVAAEMTRRALRTALERATASDSSDPEEAS